METPAQASRATVTRHTRGAHRVVNDVEVGGAWRLRHPPRSIFVLSWARGIAGVSASSALRDGSPSSLSSTYPYTLSTARRLISVPAAQFPRIIFGGNSSHCIKLEVGEGQDYCRSHLAPILGSVLPSYAKRSTLQTL